ncbi:EboA family metabolite traffic protein [Nodularia spumigena CS-591/04]|uniref:EboA family metabolite traffic protein n=1 Tax=Nodularia spumigena TaxID=70799 RepID=UPI00232C4FC5|nr:EboA family metabolite traffic protein [Nodularia spumigena]MDB9320355.1 EboA family metabolite traffic protein [Nodularia spumigena CS-591/07A]MDB9331488.1 EboA family metabolite traffic protein [Nodularia spumigena CS-591/04]MDB9363046.1 EboA family metabolite traffic protein [Nodularia spumigena CS-588/02]MDB9364716.1 EboA family metabolite traffic protein [Nodularia spumigena CS-588/02A10]
MSAVIYLKQTSITSLLRHWVSLLVTPEALTWLDNKREQIRGGELGREFFTAFSAVSRYTGKQQLKLNAKDLKAAAVMQVGWCPGHWSVDQAARTLLVLALPQDDREKYLHALEQVFTTADGGELVALYQALPLLPYPEQLQKRAAEGVRSNMIAVFDAIALQNPYPAQYFNTPAWNQMVLKALFIGRPLHLIQGLDLRANRDLAKMLINYAHERQSANRPVPAELWQLVNNS